MSWLSVFFKNLGKTKPLVVAETAAAGAVVANKPVGTAIGDAFLNVAARAAESTVTDLVNASDARALAQKILTALVIAEELAAVGNNAGASAKLAALQAELEKALGA